MKTYPKPQFTKDVHWSKVIQYQLIMEPTAGALLRFLGTMRSNELNNVSLKRASKQFGLLGHSARNFR